MEDVIIAAIKERVSLGQDKATIIAELQEKGYEAELAEQYYAKATAATPATAIPVPPPVPPVPTAPEASPTPVADTVSPEVASLATPTKTPGYVTLGIVCLIISILVAGGYWLYTQVSPVSLTSFFGAAPYSTETEFTRGILQSSRDLTAHSFNLEYGIYFEPRAEDTPVLDTEWSNELEELGDFANFTLPDEGSISFTAAGLVDARDQENPEFDIDMQGSVLVEPIAMSMAGSLRLTDKRLYGRIDDLPVSSMFADQYLEELASAFPLETWVLLLDIAELEEQFGSGLDDMLIPGLPQVLDTETAPALSNTAVPDWTAAMSASPVMAYGLGSLSPNEEEAEAIAMALYEAAVEETPFVFAGEPVRVERNGERLFEYTIDLRRDRLLAFADALGQKLVGATEDFTIRDHEQMMEELPDMLPEQSGFDEFNRLVDVVYSVRPDGQIAGFRIESTVTSPRESVTGQVRLLFEMMVSPQNDGLEITEPADVHPQSLVEMEEERRKQQVMERHDNSIRWQFNSLRSSAEIHYNESGFSYAGFCDSSDVASLSFWIDDLDITCNDSDDAYAVYAPFKLKEGLYCVDSTGFANSVKTVAGPTECGDDVVEADADEWDSLF